MSRRVMNQSGGINPLLLPLIAVVLLLIGAGAVAAWAYSGRQDYKNNVDAKVATAVVSAKQAESTVKEKEFAERSKSPYNTYTGPLAYGGVVIKYPRTWSGYVSDTTGADPFVNGYFSPGVVPDVQAENSSFALRVMVTQASYSDTLAGYQQQAQDGTVTVQPYSLPKLPSVVGAMVTGELTEQTQGTMVILPLRDKTLELWTDSDQYKADFTNIILANATFSP